MRGLTLRDRKTAVWVSGQTGVAGIIDSKKKCTLAGHVMRRLDNWWTGQLVDTKRGEA